MQRPTAVRRVCLILSSVLFSLWLSMPNAHADDVADEADAQFNLGAAEYQASHFEVALSHFLASNRLARNKNVLFNIARCYEQLRHFPEAHRYYTRARAEETNEVSLAAINAALERISDRVAVLDIVTDPPGARIFLDRKDLGDRGTAPQVMALPPRTYTVIAELDGWKDATSETVQVRVGRKQSVSLKLVRIVGTLRVTGPSGAALRLDTDNSPEICRAPCDVPVPPGQHTLLVSSAGHRSARFPVLVQADQTSVIRPELVPETGSLVVNADERGATVTVDGAEQGFTPTILALSVGPHHVQVSLRGYRSIERDIVVAADQQLRLDVELFSSDSVEAASRLEEPVEQAPASVSLINSEELRAMRYPTLAEALRGTRGVFLSDDRGYQALGFRGFGRLGSYGNRVLVTLDGTPVNDDWVWSSYVGLDLRTDLEDIDHIEVVRGPGSVVYGTSAFSGVVNLVTRGKGVPTGREIGLSVAADGVARARARVTQHFGANAGVWASVAAGQSSGRDFFFADYVSDGPPEVAGNARGIDGARFATLTGRAWWKELSLSWSLHHHDKHLPTGQFEALFGDGRTHQADTRGFVEGRFDHQFGPALSSMTRAHADTYAYRGYFAYSPADGGVETDTYDSTWGGAEQRFVFSPVGAVSFTLGGEAQLHPSARQKGDTELDGSFLDDERDFSIAALYGSADLHPSEAFKLSAGGRLDYYSTFGSSFSPRLALIAQPYSGGNLKVVVGSAFKAPSIYELSYTSSNQLSSPDLAPEKIYSGEIELSQRLTRTLTLTVAAYSNMIVDLISLDDVPPGPDGTEYVQFQNADIPVGTLGGEIELRREWKEGWMVAGSYSFQRSAYLASDSVSSLFSLERSSEFREVPNAPSHLASLKAAVPLLTRAVTLMNRLSYESARYDNNDSVDPDTLQGRTPGAWIWDLVVSGKETRFGLDYSIGVYNAFDSRGSYPVSAEFRQLSAPALGRSFLAAVNLTF